MAYFKQPQIQIQQQLPKPTPTLATEQELIPLATAPTQTLSYTGLKIVNVPAQELQVGLMPSLISTAASTQLTQQNLFAGLKTIQEPINIMKLDQQPTQELQQQPVQQLKQVQQTEQVIDLNVIEQPVVTQQVLTPDQRILAPDQAAEITNPLERIIAQQSAGCIHLFRGI